MDRRHFVKNSFYASGFAAAANRISIFGEKPGLPHASPVRYIRDRAPVFQIPEYTGERYVDTVPDTLDVAERAKLGVNVLTSITDPAFDDEIYWSADFFRNPVVVQHDFNDWVQNQEGMLESLSLLRNATGDNSNLQVDRAWMTSILRSIGPDGLVYLPLDGRPWGRLHADGINPVWKPDGTQSTFRDSSVTQVANAATCERILATMTLFYRRDQNPMWKAAGAKMVGRLSALAIPHGDYVYFAPGSFAPGAKPARDSKMPLGSTWGVSWNTRLIQGLMQYYKVAQLEPARELAEKLVAYTCRHGEIFYPDGRWYLDPEIRGDFESDAVPSSIRKNYPVAGLQFGGHGHGHGVGVRSLIEYAEATGDKQVLLFSKESFEWARNPGAQFGVSTLVGWFPEFYIPEYPSCEGCIVGDMISMAVKLSSLGAGDYWDDVDRWVRNQFFEQQLTDVDWVYRLAARSPAEPVGSFESAHRAAERNIGAFGGGASASDWALGVASRGIGHCCTGTCTHAIYYVWEHMLECSGEDLRVNLLLNRASRWADVYSYIPFHGHVSIKVKRPCRNMRVRAPEWVEQSDPALKCTVNGMSRVPQWEGRYLNLGPQKPGDRAELTFPIAERTIHERIGAQSYQLVAKGNTVLSISPSGKNGPLYQDRAKYRTGELTWKRVTRFVPAEDISY